jgi:hypothetical protein
MDLELKPQHWGLLNDVANQLGGSSNDALEFILNCWMVGQAPAPVKPTPQVFEPGAEPIQFLIPKQPSDHVLAVSDAEFAQLTDWS